MYFKGSVSLVDVGLDRYVEISTKTAARAKDKAKKMGSVVGNKADLANFHSEHLMEHCKEFDAKYELAGGAGFIEEEADIRPSFVALTFTKHLPRYHRQPVEPLCTHMLRHDLSKSCCLVLEETDQLMTLEGLFACYTTFRKLPHCTMSGMHG